MVWMEYVDDFIEGIKGSLPPDHELLNHELFSGIKWQGRDIFIVDDDTTGEYLLMDLERMKPWGKSRGKSMGKVPAITVLKTIEEVSALIEKDHQTEIAKYNKEGEVKQPQNQEEQLITDESGSR